MEKCSYRKEKKAKKNIAVRFTRNVNRSNSEFTDGILKLLRSPGIDSVSLCRQAGRYDNPVSTRFLAPIDCSKIPALFKFAYLYTL